MASICRDISIAASANDVWDAVSDVGAVHRRLAKGFVTDTRLEAGARTVTFITGVVARELLLAVDDEQRRVAYSVVGGPLIHHNSSMQVVRESDRTCRLVWITDLLPNELAEHFTALIDMGAQAMKQTLEAR